MARVKKKYFLVMGYDGDYKARDLDPRYTHHRIYNEFATFEEAEEAALEWAASAPPKDNYRNKPYLTIEHTRYGASAIKDWKGEGGEWVLKYDVSERYRKKKRTRKKAAKKNPSLRSIMAKALK